VRVTAVIVTAVIVTAVRVTAVIVTAVIVSGLERVYFVKEIRNVLLIDLCVSFHGQIQCECIWERSSV
jgi:hypothetical protein